MLQLRRWAFASTVVVLAALAGCAGVPPTPSQPAGRTEPATPPGKIPEGPPAAVAREPAGSKQTLIAAAKRHAAKPKQALNVRTSCRFADETGYNGHLDLDVRDDTVRSLVAEVNIPRHGSCHFNLDEFRPDGGSRGSVALTGRGCTVRLWEQEARVSVAFSNCAAQCNGGAHEYVWPILVDSRTGRCS